MYELHLLALIFSLLANPTIWVRESQIPRVPLFMELEKIPIFVDIIAFGFFLTALIISSIFQSHRKILLNLSISLWIALCFTGLIRLQPYYFYFFVALASLGGKNAEESGQKSKYSLFILFMGFWYFWAGVHKFNNGFASEIFPWLVSGVFRSFDFNFGSPWLGLTAAAMEATAGLGLFFKFSRTVSALALATTHIAIIAFIGPFGHNIHAPVWSWNLLQSIVLLRVFLFEPLNLRGFGLLGTRRKNLLFGLCLFLPALNFANLWPDNLSGHLYSGSMTQAEVLVSDEFLEYYNIPREKLQLSRMGEQALPWRVWSELDNGHFFFPWGPYYLRAFKKTCKTIPDVISSKIKLIVLPGQRHPLQFNLSRSVYECKDLMKDSKSL